MIWYGIAHLASPASHRLRMRRHQPAEVRRFRLRAKPIIISATCFLCAYLMVLAAHKGRHSFPIQASSVIPMCAAAQLLATQHRYGPLNQRYCAM